MIAEKRERLGLTTSPRPALEERDLLDLVALGTVADLAPLLGENRFLVQRGLAELKQPRRRRHPGHDGRGPAQSRQSGRHQPSDSSWGLG